MNILLSTIKKFFSSKFNIYLIIFLLFTGTLAYFVTQEEVGEESEDEFTVYFFYLPTCPHCSEQKPILKELEQEMPEVSFVWYDASSEKGSRLFYQMASEAGLDTSELGVPMTFISKHVLRGLHTKEEIKSQISQCMKECKDNEEITKVGEDRVNTGFKDFELPIIGRTDLTKFSLPSLSIILGLIDGFNPCAMWVLVYLIGLLVGIGDRKKIWFIVGSFVLASGILYFLFMTAWINLFLIIGYIKIITILIGLIALGGGIINIKDYLTKKSLSCDVGDTESHEKTMKKIKDVISQPLSISIMLSIIGLAFAVNSIEFVCSSAIPTVFTQILALSGLSALQYYLYIGLYVLFFMMDDLVIFSLAAFSIGSVMGEKYAKYCKLFGGIILLILGLILVFAPHLLR